MGVPLKLTLCFSLAAFRIFSLTFAIVIITCVGLGLFGFNLFGDLCASCILRSVSLDLESFQAIISSIYFYFPFLFFSFWNPYYQQIGLLYIIPHISYIVFIFFFIWLSVCCPDWVISIILSSKLLIRSSALFILLFNAFNSALSWQMNFLVILVPPYSFQFLFKVICITVHLFLIPSVFSLPTF